MFAIWLKTTVEHGCNSFDILKIIFNKIIQEENLVQNIPLIFLSAYLESFSLPLSPILADDITEISFELSSVEWDYSLKVIIYKVSRRRKFVSKAMCFYINCMYRQ